ncbi:hypothetical protein WICMUC_004323 [Wickerhamomyces mucosus]|uniref:Mediator of RNA polymerase II transcription subunit 4 n=1 Tax=Wickerhamomyces mucosus TaxID=1378264 RepID=A0A9P8TBN1_9ASCO|nr:hypothetical protein WICMUC_004323 [Wickerhamomyces mucosus]
MSQKVNIPISRPVSSANIVTSSRAATPDVVVPKSDVHLKRVANLPISKDLNDFEKTLNSFLTSVTKYNPSVKDAENLLKIEERLNESLNDIITHQQSGLEIDEMQEKSIKLDSDCSKVLHGLMECRKELSSLQSLEKVTEERNRMAENTIKADDLLQYAMKLAKFTSAPPTFDANSIGPNNFIWPGEDSLRRGVLALASLNPGKLTGEDPNQINGNSVQNDGTDKIRSESRQESSTQRRGSFGNYGGDDGEDDNDVIEDLDLFDPDEE